MPDSLDFDNSAAWMRRAQADFHAFLETFSARMEIALPDRVVVERRKDGFFSKTQHVEKFTLQTSGVRYGLSRRGAGLVPSVAREVRGIVISSKEVPLKEWMEQLDQDLKAMAAEAGTAFNVFNDFMAS